MREPRNRYLAELEKLQVDHEKAVLLAGPSGIGKTVIAEAYAEISTTGPVRVFETYRFLSLYRASWTEVLSDLRTTLLDVPPNATPEEIQQAALDMAGRTRLLLILDNVDSHNVDDVRGFVADWVRLGHSSCVLLTAQDDVASQLPEIARIDVSGIEDDAAVLKLFGETGRRFPHETLLEVADELGRNPLKILLLNWLNPPHVAALRESASHLRTGNTESLLVRAIEKLPGLFFFALGLHRGLQVTDEMLAFLWDHLGSRGAEPYVRTRDVLVSKRFLLPTSTPGRYRIHESVHVQLPKVLRTRVEHARLAALHHYFAEYYRRTLREAPRSVGLTNFTHHALAAGEVASAFQTLVKDGATDRLAGAVTAAQVLQELELVLPHAMKNLETADVAELLLALGGLCNDLSNHRKCLAYMDQFQRVSPDIVDSRTRERFERRAWYLIAVSNSNLGQSDLCLQFYYRIVASCCQVDDPLACLALGYLAHDLKYRDIRTARTLGERSLAWAQSSDSGIVLAKNLCSLAETLVLDGDHSTASALFEAAESRAQDCQDERELGRIRTNWGFGLLLDGKDDESAAMISSGEELSRSVGDRRREAQAILYGGIARVLLGDPVGGQTALHKAVSIFYELGDGRYFVPGLYWARQLAGLDWDVYPPRPEGVDGNGMRPEWIDRANESPWFTVYYEFWKSHLAGVLENRT